MLYNKHVIRTIKNFFHFINALCAVCFYGYPASKLKVIGVTGTDGKTTTSTLIYHLLQTAGKKVALITTVGGFIGDKQIDTGFHTTTPNPWLLQKLIREIVKQKFDYLVLESTSHGLDQHRLLGSNRLVGVMTNLSHEHLDYHGTKENYLKAKAKLFRGVQYAVLNSNDESFEPLKSIIRKLVVTYSNANIPIFVKNRFPEKYNQMNAQAAIAVARIFALDEADIEYGIKTFQGVSGRAELVKNSKDVRVIVDFAHTPNAVSEVLTALKKTTKGKLIVVFGATGRRDVTKRPKMGEIVSRLSDFFIITTDDSYDEKIGVIINQIKSGVVVNHGVMLSTIDRAKAIEYAVSIAKKGDTIALLGKGHEKTLNIDGKTEIVWSDQVVATNTLKRKK